MPTQAAIHRCKWRGHDWATDVWSLIPLEPRGELAGCETECSRCESTKYEEFTLSADRVILERFGRVKYRPSQEFREHGFTRADARQTSFAHSGARRRLKAVS